MTKHSPNDEIRTPEVGEICGVAPSTVSDWIRTGKLKAKKLNGRHLISRSDLAAFTKMQKNEVVK